jgi:hypothetical protein
MSEEVEYIEPVKGNNCPDCKWSAYDSTHDDRWCKHRPEPTGLHPMFVVDRWGSCGYFTKDGVTHE